MVCSKDNFIPHLKIEISTKAITWNCEARDEKLMWPGVKASFTDKGIPVFEPNYAGCNGLGGYARSNTQYPDVPSDACTKSESVKDMISRMF